MIVYTIGHSTRTIVEFEALLRESQIELVADVRSIPRSRTNPQFNLEVLPVSLAESGIGYQAGILIAASMTFGYLAVRHMLGTP